MSRLSDLSASAMLREYAQGVAQDNVQPVAEFLAPTVPVATSVGRYKVYNEKHRFRIPQTLRGIGGVATNLSFTTTDATYNCEPHALDFAVDNLEKLEEKSLANTLEEGATMIAEVAGLVHEKAVIDQALSSVGAGTNVTFTGASDDPVNQIDAQILNVIKTVAYGSVMGVGILFGANAFKAFKNSPLCRARFTTAGGNAIPNITPESASALLIGTPDVRVSYMVYDTAAEGATASMSFILDTSVLIFARKAQPSRRDPSFMKTFRLVGNYMVPGSYMREDGRAEVAKFDWSEDIVTATSNACVRLVVTDAS